jgi:hypothetical protein
MAITRKTHWFVRSAAVLALAAFASGAAEAGNFELTYDLTVNQGSPPFASLTSSGPLPAGTKLTFTAKFNTDSANQWNIGAWIYTAFDETVVIRAPSAPPTFYTLVPVGLYEILLSDPSWATFGGPAPYSAGLIKFENGLGSINSVFDASTQTVRRRDPIRYHVLRI